MKKTHWSRWLVRLQWILLLGIFMAGAALRMELLPFGTVFKVFQYLGLAVLAIALVCMPLFIWGLIKRNSEVRWTALKGVILGLIPIAVPLFTVGRENFEVPAIHDITTDLANPPAYVTILSLRDDDDNNPAYEGERVAKLQREAGIYDDIQPLVVEPSVAVMTRKAGEVAESLGWRVVAISPEQGRVEAVDRTPLLGFRDDVVVRITEHEGGSKVDVRSSSRVGVSDLGANAQRIRTFLEALKQKVREAE